MPASLIKGHSCTLCFKMANASANQAFRVMLLGTTQVECERNSICPPVVLQEWWLGEREGLWCASRLGCGVILALCASKWPMPVQTRPSGLCCWVPPKLNVGDTSLGPLWHCNTGGWGKERVVGVSSALVRGSFLHFVLQNGQCQCKPGHQGYAAECHPS